MLRRRTLAASAGSTLPMNDLVRAFETAGVPLTLPRVPMQPVNAEIFQMDLGEWREHVRIWTGADGNVVEALDAQEEFEQVLLRVEEPSRAFERKIAKRERAKSIERQTGFSRILRETPYNWIVEFRTPAQERRFLCGRDETHLFIAQVREGETVVDAHESLKPEVVRAAEQQGIGPIRRQGEWFFVPVTEREARKLDGAVDVRSYAVLESGTNRPHFAEQLVPTVEQMFVRGEITHEDHLTLTLEDWHLVERNREILDEARRRGVLWID